MTMKMAVLPSSRKEDTPSSSSSSNAKSPSNSATRPRPPAVWSVHESKQWLGRHCGDLGVHYSELFDVNNVNGKVLLRMNEVGLERMGVKNSVHRQEIWREIIKLKLKSDVLELRDLETQISK